LHLGPIGLALFQSVEWLDGLIYESPSQPSIPQLSNTGHYYFSPLTLPDASSN